MNNNKDFCSIMACYSKQSNFFHVAPVFFLYDGERDQDDESVWHKACCYLLPYVYAQAFSTLGPAIVPCWLASAIYFPLILRGRSHIESRSGGAGDNALDRHAL
jgi:hypothetical protein